MRVIGTQLNLNLSIEFGCGVANNMIEHVRAQELIAAAATTVKVQQENVRVPVELAKPLLPTAAMIDEHALTHFPYEDRCETCVMHKAWQDAHVAPGHERKQHSVMSFDFGIASRTADDKLTVLYLHHQFTKLKLMGAIPTPQKAGR